MTAFTQTCTESLSLVEVLVSVPDIDTMARWVNLLDGSWSASTGGIKPRIIKVIDEKRIDVGTLDYVLVYPSGEAKKPQGVGYDSREVQNTQSVDCRTSKGHWRIQQMKREIDRIMMANRSNKSATGYQVVTGPVLHDLSDKMRMIFKYVLDYTGTTYAEPIMG
jgi:hypothetical protein